ncbi:MAG: SPASM domain-containing protein [Bryobacteraceae bacterium]
MESIYFVLTWLCHRTCEHCYEERFRPYYGEDLRRVVEESRTNMPRIIENLPERMQYLNLNDPDGLGGFREKRGRIIVAGGEILLDPVREPVLYPAIEQLQAKYRDDGGVELVVQTTGDILTERIVRELLERGVSVISVSGLDAYHEGIGEPAAQERLRAKLTAIFRAHGMEEWQPAPRPAGARYFHFFGATPESWIGKLWPRGRAHRNELSQATLADNFCNRWSGGLNFLAYRYSGSEVSIEPNGNVYPCCLKTKAPVGNLLEEKLEAILDRLAGDPVYEAISMGHPERMGIAHGWSVEKFLERSTVRLPSGRVYQNLCIGCDAFHEEVLGRAAGALVSIRAGTDLG